MWPSHRPIGSAIAVASAIATMQSFRCSQMSWKLFDRPPTSPPPRPVRGWTMKSRASPNVEKMLAVTVMRARVQGVMERWTMRMIPSRTTASSTQSPPAKTTFVLNAFCASSGSPRPPAPAKNASAASPTVVVVAIRSPAMIAGSASGSSTRHSSWRSVSPMPRPASRASSGTESSPASVLRKRISSV